MKRNILFLAILSFNYLFTQNYIKMEKSDFNKVKISKENVFFYASPYFLERNFEDKNKIKGTTESKSYVKINHNTYRINTSWYTMENEYMITTIVVKNLDCSKKTFEIIEFEVLNISKNEKLIMPTGISSITEIRKNNAFYKLMDTFSSIICEE